MSWEDREDKKIQVMELFGPTIQGEGIMSGTVTHFLRTGGCPLRCSWCDSLFSVLPEEIKKYRHLMTTWEIIDAVLALPKAPYITFTGGDPAIQTRLGDIIPAMNDAGMRVAIETQGMYFPPWLSDCDVLTFSPKGPSSGNVVGLKDLSEFCVSLGKKRKQKVCIKVVIFNQEDFDYAMRVYELIPPTYYDAFYFTAGTPMLEHRAGYKMSPLEKTAGVIQNEQAIAEMLLRKSRSVRFNEKVHIGCQIHVLLWPDKDKGV